MASHFLPPSQPDLPPASSDVLASQAEDLLEYVPVGVLVIELPSLRITRTNEAMRRLCMRAFGRECAEPDGRLISWMTERGLLAQVATALALGCTFPRQIVECPGEGSVGQLWLAIEVAPLTIQDTPDGVRRRVLIQFTDCTEERRERLRSERALFSAQLYAEGLEAALEHLTEGVTILDASGDLRAYNRAALTLARNRRAVERARAHGARLEPIWDLRAADGTVPDETARPEWRALLTGAPVNGVEMLLIRERGEPLPVLVSAAPLRDESGAVSGVVTALHDLTALKAVERLKDEFISNASHELRQPLTVIRGQAQMLRRYLARAGAQGTLPAAVSSAFAGQVEGINAQTARLDRLVSDLLEVSRLQAGEVQLELARVSLVEIVRGVVEQQRHVSARHTLDLRVGRYGQGIMVECDRRRIEQILMNLIANAIKYSPDGGTVTIEVGSLTEKCVREQPEIGGQRRVQAPAGLVKVADQGIGIPPESLPRLFERFFRARNASGIQGTGLGLYICRQLAWAHGGNLWAESGGEGAGTAFHLALPLIISAEEPPHPVTTSSP
jgi:two-component system, OmpR family, phosphate regulon sensor histidine kinase PhoR